MINNPALWLVIFTEQEQMTGEVTTPVLVGLIVLLITVLILFYKSKK
ncbi:MAG: LPXTG cell wall anchor domain-containing protein [Campylobacteraceae bacterium]|jgi:LPXTG-motif cell wall-anchored protein|nr:LPXTG cell wall anchor domain-containing protein [Campylobacteraceae bacterium]